MINHRLSFSFLISIVLSGASLFASEAVAQPPLPDPVFHNGFESPNQAPVADAGADQSATVGAPLSLDGSDSFDPEGAELDFAWSVVQRPDGSGAELFQSHEVDPVLVPDRAGMYVVQLIVSDGELFSEPATVIVTASGTLAASAMIGSTGGAVGLPDGASVLIPPGALDGTVSITIAEIGLPPGAVLPPTGVLAGSVYQLTPSGQTFQLPVRLVIPYDPDLLPPEYSVGAIAIYRHGDWPSFNRAGSGSDEEDDEDGHFHGDGQILDIDARLTSVLTPTFSAYAAISVRSSTQFTPVTLTSANTSVEVRRPPTMRTQRASYHQCMVPRSSGGGTSNAATALNSRTTSQIGSVIIHSTNNGNVGRNFNDELGWGADDCNRHFAHYYIDRDGTIYQMVDDLRIALHTNPSNSLVINNTNAIGIELFLNVGEPFDGRQVSALIRLVDYLADTHAIARPQRDQSTGVYVRNRTSINTGGDRFVSHVDVDSGKCDPSGTFRDSGIIKPEHRDVPQCGAQDPKVTERVLSVGNSQAPALLDMVTDAITVLDRDSQHTGIINTSGGDAFDLGQAGDAGDVAFREDAAAVATQMGTAERLHWQENDPNLTGQPAGVPVGPGPLIVARGVTTNLTGPMREYTDVIVAGTLNVTGPLELRATGSVYVSPTGRIMIRNGRDGGDLTIYSRGTPIIQGLIDARGEAGVAGTINGGRGGHVAFTFSAPGVLLAPTILARGGDADFANIMASGGGPRGGHGGDIRFDMESAHVFLGGGLGPYVAPTQLPPLWFVGTIDASLFTADARWTGDYLPPSPPVRRYSIGPTWPPSPPLGSRVPIRTGSWQQQGFRRGLLNAGGTGGYGVGTANGNQHGGPAGNGGSIQVQMGGDGRLTFRDVDIATGGEIETIAYRFYMPPPAVDGLNHWTCTPAGSHGGFGQDVSGMPAGNGGPGGNAGAASVAGGSILPAPVAFDVVQDTRGFPATHLAGDQVCARGTQVIGHIVRAKDAAGKPLYRLRVDTSRQQLLGGHGGIPSGRRATGSNPGSFGARGANGALSGLPTQ